MIETSALKNRQLWTLPLSFVLFWANAFTPHAAQAETYVLDFQQVKLGNERSSMECTDGVIAQRDIKFITRDNRLDKISAYCIGSSRTIYLRFMYKEKALVGINSDFFFISPPDKGIVKKTFFLQEPVPPPTGYPSDFNNFYLLKRSMDEAFAIFEVTAHPGNR